MIRQLRYVLTYSPCARSMGKVAQLMAPETAAEHRVARRAGAAVRRAAIGTALVFAMNGAVQASWMARLPAIRASLDISLSSLGLALFAMGVGSLMSMPLTGRLCYQYGSRRIVRVAALAACTALAALGFVSTLHGLVVVLCWFGLASGAWDVAMNVQGKVIEQKADRHWMTWFHGCWSAGSVVGAGFGALAIRTGLLMSRHFLLSAAIGIALCGISAGAFVDERESSFFAGTASLKHLANRGLILLAALTFCGATIEGSAGDWLAIYFTQVRHLSHARGATGYAIFVAAMMIGRFVAAEAHRRLGRTSTVRAGTIAAAIGIVVSILAPTAAIAYAGTATWGLGICVVVPAALSACEHLPYPGDAVTAITTVAYSASLVAPPLVGAVADRIGLEDALLLLPILAVVVTMLASTVSQLAADDAD
jgi:fucose permease